MPVAVARLRELIDLAGSDGVECIDIVENGTRIRITRAGAARAAAPGLAAPAPRAGMEVLTRKDTADGGSAASGARGGERDILAAPMFGVLHLTPAPGARPFVAVGERVAKGQQLCLIEAMKMFTAFHSDRDGALEAILAEPGEEVSSGQPLFRISAA